MDLFKDITGQESAKRAMTDWYLHETQPLLLYGSSGFGKTMFANALGAYEIDTTHVRSNRLESILKPLKEAEDDDILFFDEVHSLGSKVLEGFYKVIDKHSFYDEELCMELPLPKARLIFATNLLDKLPEAFINRCRLVELQDYSEDELKEIIHKAYPDIQDGLNSIVKASKGVPRTALSLAKSVIAGAKTDEKLLNLDADEVNSILKSRMNINPDTGLSDKEYLIVQKVADRGHLSTTAIANLLKITTKDATNLYINPLRASEWLAVSNHGVILGYKGHENYRLFCKGLK